MTLHDLIQQLGLTGTPEEIAAALNAKTQPVYNSELYTSTGVILELGPDLARQALAGFLAAAQSDPLLQSQYDKLNSTGIDFSHPLTQQMIDDLKNAGAFSEPVATALKSVGVKYKSPYEIAFGDGAVVTPEQVEAALQPLTATDRQYTLSCIINGNNSDICHLIIRNVAGDIVVDTTHYGSVNSSPSGDAAVDDLFASILSLMRQFILRR